MYSTAQTPPPELLKEQARWLAPARARLLRRAEIAKRRRVLDLGAAFGIVTEELQRRCGGSVVALDSSLAALKMGARQLSQVSCICGDAENLPFLNRSFDLIFSQCSLMWMNLDKVIPELHRVLEPGGVLTAIEPDYGGMIEYPASIATRDVWIAALSRAGADPFVGRKLAFLLSAHGFNLSAEFLPELHPPSAKRFELLRGLPLEPDELARLDRIEQSDRALTESRAKIVHLPFFLIRATRC
jgi:SAM-dependent methyltransferase